MAYYFTLFMNQHLDLINVPDEPESLMNGLSGAVCFFQNILEFRNEIHFPCLDPLF